MNKMPLIVSHYTVNTGYEKEVKNLIKSLETLGLKYHVEGIQSLGSWRANSNYCAKQVQKALVQFPDEDILRVDADAIFQKYPDLFLSEDFKADVAAHIHSFPWKSYELLGGTLFFRNTPQVKILVDDWEAKAALNVMKDRPGDILQKLLRSKKYKVIFSELPAEYCKIFDSMKEVKYPVIEHFQASRRLKRQINTLGRTIHV